MPASRNSATRPGEEVSAISCTRPRNARAALSPTSPHPITSTRSRRKREGAAPRGPLIEGKIQFLF
jgi:hypothetical protein